VYNRPISIPKIETISKAEFEQKYLRKNIPVVICGLNSDWKARMVWNISYLKEKIGGYTSGVIKIKNGMYVINTERGSKLDYILVKECLECVESKNIENGWSLASPIENFDDKLSADYTTFSYCSDGRFLRTRLFVGAKGLVTSLHQDLYENLYTMVKGEKKIILYPPNQSSLLYRYPYISKFPNGAKVDPEKPDYKRFPRFEKANAWVVDLKAGETLYIPSYWWHYLRNLDESIAVSFWWGYGWKLIPVWLAALYKKIRKI
jgi:oxalate decarboxylase/phosphoglucose isomerase-like protein (cupin superfamily)